MTKTLLWRALTLDGTEEFGVIENLNRLDALRQLKGKGLYQISLERVPESDVRSPLKSRQILVILESIKMMLDSGISFNDTLGLLVKEKQDRIVQLVFRKLKTRSLEGDSLEGAFKKLSPLFSDFFVSMIGLSEDSGQLTEGLQSLIDYYHEIERRAQEARRLLRYPKIVIGFTIGLVVLIIWFIIPMFKNIYLLFGDDLPFLTKGMVALSALMQQYYWAVLTVVFGLILWEKLPLIGSYHPIRFLLGRFTNLYDSKNDISLYAHAMKILLENGQTTRLATLQAASCLSYRNRRHGEALANALSEGYSFAESFQKVKWFPKIFKSFIDSAEKSGSVKIGFEQVFLFLKRQNEDRFARLIRFTEPVLMVIMGGIVLTVLLAIYLPIFELGNKIG